MEVVAFIINTYLPTLQNVETPILKPCFNYSDIIFSVLRFGGFLVLASCCKTLISNADV